MLRAYTKYCIIQQLRRHETQSTNLNAMKVLRENYNNLRSALRIGTQIGENRKANKTEYVFRISNSLRRIREPGAIYIPKGDTVRKKNLKRQCSESMGAIMHPLR